MLKSSTEAIQPFPGAEGEVTPLTLPPWGCNALLELLALRECLGTKRRHPKHIGRSACHCGQTEPQTPLFKHNPADTAEKVTQVSDPATLTLDSFLSDAGRDAGRLGGAVGRTGQIRLLC